MVVHPSQQAAHISIMSVLVFIPSRAAYVLAEGTWATALQYKCVLFYTGWSRPPPLSLSLMFLWAVKNGSAQQELSQKILHWKEMKLVFVRQTRVPAVEAWLELTAGVEFICFRQPVKLYDVCFLDADCISVKEAVEDMMLVFKWLLILRPHAVQYHEAFLL